MSSKITQEFLSYKGIISSLLNKLGYISAPDIEDILQETYIRTYKSAIEREIKFPKAYMVKTALRLAKESLIRQSSQAHVDISEPMTSKELVGESSDEPENSCISMQEFNHLCEAVNQLPPQCRKVFIMKKIFGFSQKEIAQNLCLSESTVEKHIAKGMVACVRYLKSPTAHLPAKAREPSDPNTEPRSRNEHTH